jgi:hypothetical protein
MICPFVRHAMLTYALEEDGRWRFTRAEMGKPFSFRAHVRKEVALTDMMSKRFTRRPPSPNMGSGFSHS